MQRRGNLEELHKNISDALDGIYNDMQSDIKESTEKIMAYYTSLNDRVNELDSKIEN